MVPLNRERKIILICGMVLLLAGAAYRFSSSLPSFFGKSDEVSFKEKELTKYREVLQEKRKVEMRLISVERELARVEAGLLSQATSALAAVEIENMLSDMIEKEGMRLLSMRVLKSEPTEKGEYMTVPVEIKMIANIRQIKEVLFTIKNSKKLLRVASIRLRLPNIRRPEEIDCTMVVEGLMKSGKR
jgi:Tfp pilus assembly protein PilO